MLFPVFEIYRGSASRLALRPDLCCRTEMSQKDIALLHEQGGSDGTSLQELCAIRSDFLLHLDVLGVAAEDPDVDLAVGGAQRTDLDPDLLAGSKPLDGRGGLAGSDGGPR